MLKLKAKGYFFTISGVEESIKVADEEV